MDSSDNYENKIKMIMRQTSYTREETEEKMKEYDNNVEKVILNFLGGSKVKERETTNNQKIFKAFRELY
jgi:hypothetical protein